MLRTPPNAPLIVTLLALLMGLQPLTTDLYLPALPLLQTDLGARMEQTQLTLSALLLAFGVSQLVWGPLSDRWGRRPVLIAGLLGYCAASLGAAYAPDIATLISARTLQGAALGAAVMGARAIVRDLYNPVQGARVMSQALSGLGVLACLSAPVGALLTQTLGWRAALLALTVAGALTLALVAWRLAETLPQTNPQALRAGVLWRTWRSILGHPTFQAYSLLSTCSYAALFTFLAASSFVFTQTLAVSRLGYGAIMLVNSLAYIAGTFLCRAWLARLGPRRTVMRAAWVSLTGGLGLAVLTLWPHPAAWLLMIPQLVFMVGHGIHQPCGQSGSVGPFAQAAGAASALNGFFMMLAAFVMGRWLGPHLGQGIAPMTLGIALWCVALAAVAWTLVRRLPDDASHAPATRATPATSAASAAPSAAATPASPLAAPSAPQAAQRPRA